MGLTFKEFMQNIYVRFPSIIQNKLYKENLLHDKIIYDKKMKYLDDEIAE